MDDIEKILPREMIGRATRSETELIFSLGDARDVVEAATKAGIAVLGVDIFRLRQAGLQTEGYTNYNFEFAGDWLEFVTQNNTAAARYLNQHQFSAGYGRTLTTTSEREFRQMREQLK